MRSTVSRTGGASGRRGRGSSRRSTWSAIRPGFAFSMTTRSDMATASSTLWVTRRMLLVITSVEAQRSSTRSRIVRAVNTSSAENGSSMHSSSGSTARARASPTSCFMPRDSSRG